MEVIFYVYIILNKISLIKMNGAFGFIYINVKMPICNAHMDYT